MTLISMLIASAVVGWLAHSFQNRSAQIWGLITFGAMAATWLVFDYSISNDPSVNAADVQSTLAIIVSVGVGFLMAIIVAILPKQSRKKKCPFCAEDIKEEATVCRFCGKDLPTE